MGYIGMWIFGSLMTIIGILIMKYQLVGIIANYNEKKTKDKKDLAKWVGGNLIIIGLVEIFIGIFNLISSGLIPEGYSLFVFAVIHLVLSIRIAFGFRKFQQ